MSKTEKMINSIVKTIDAELDWADKNNKPRIVTLFTVSEAQLILHCMEELKRRGTMKDHDMTEYANRNGYDRALTDFIAVAKEALTIFTQSCSRSDFEWGAIEGVKECIKAAEKLRAKNNGENEENTDTNETDLLQTHLPVDKT